MTIPNDPAILLSFINTKLRDEYADLDDLCRSLNLSEKDIMAKLALLGYAYDVNTNRFK